MTVFEADALLKQLPSLAGIKALVVGDLMLDRYVYGTVERISPEAPIPVLHISSRTAMPGGAGNVARNLAALDARVQLLSVTGDDDAGRELADLLGANDHIGLRLVVSPVRTTAVKSRFIASTQQLLRADDETIAPLSQTARQALLDHVRPALEDCALVVISDYGKGVLADGVASAIIETARASGRPVIVDPKGRDYRPYAGADILTPNARELAEATGMPTRNDSEVEAACRALIAAIGVGSVVATRGPQGMTLVEGTGPAVHLASRALEVFDVSGAGDTVVAALAAARAAGASLPLAAAIANAAAGVVVAKLGTATCSLADLTSALTDISREANVKIMGRDRIAAEVARWQAAGLKVGFTNGCFDLLHPGHVSLLRQARAACDRLVVGLNSDGSVRRLKGEARPVNSEMARATVLASLADVDRVVVFDEDTPLELIRQVRPDVLVKGADYSRDNVVGADLVEGWGGRLVLAALTPGHSTTRIVDRMGGGGA
jgi:D-beta-D-heptose 7-phosphate kinase/D-beta-D-heptose 1-phosphate adenosyltransferase